MSTSTSAPSLSAGTLLARRFSVRSAGVVYALVLLVAVIATMSETQGRSGYLSSVNISNILDQTALIGILAIFMTVVLISGNFDLSVASTAALAGTVALKTIDGHGVLFAFVAAVLVGALVGFVNAVLVQKVGVNAFIVTLGTLTAVRGVVEAILDGQSITAKETALLTMATHRWTMPLWLALVLAVALVGGGIAMVMRSSSRGRALAEWAVFLLAGVGLLVVASLRPLLLDQTVPTWLMIVLAVVTGAVLRFTVVGRNLYAVGGNAEAARLSGIPVDRYKMGAFVLNGAMAGVVGVLYAGRFNSVNPTVLTGGELTVIAAAVLGGTSLFGGSGYVGKSVVGALILFTLSNGFNVLNIGANYQNVVQGGVLVAAAALYTVTNQNERGKLRSRLRKSPAEPAPVTPTTNGKPASSKVA
ncbi:D-xylose transport system permease protein [Marmoricola sp. URHA0025 HA25]